jgi:hypothetical protein
MRPSTIEAPEARDADVVPLGMSIDGIMRRRFGEIERIADTVRAYYGHGYYFVGTGPRWDSAVGWLMAVHPRSEIGIRDREDLGCGPRASGRDRET